MLCAPKPTAGEDNVGEEEVVGQSMYQHIGRPPMLLQFGNKGHLQCVSLVTDQTGEWVRMVTGWHGYYKIDGRVMELAFRWKVPSIFTIPVTLQWEGEGDGSKGKMITTFCFAAPSAVFVRNTKT